MLIVTNMLWLLKALRISVILVAILAVGFITFDKILKKVEIVKPQINLIPDEIKSEHFVNSYPQHKQFLVTSPPSIVVNFDKEPASAKATIAINKKSNAVKVEKTGKSIRFYQPDGTVEEGIYLVQYQACFGSNDCSDGQFSYNIDSSRGSGLANHTKKQLVEITIDQNLTSLPNILIDKKTSVKWINQTAGTIEIRSAPKNFNNAYPALNSGEIKKGESFIVEFNTHGEYLWYLSSNPEIQVIIIVS